MSVSLSGKIAFVTGGAIGIGREIALELARSGANVAVTWFSHEQEGQTIVAEIERLGRRCLGFRLDATKSADVTAAVDRIATEFGGLDILVNNSGGLLARQEIAGMSDEHWHNVLAVNLDSTFYCCRAAAAHLRNNGRIINIASLAGHNGGGNGSAAYAASKSAMFGLTRGLAKELARHGITVNALAPGLILDTPFHENFTPKEAQNATIAGIPMGRAGYPPDVASAALWLCSEGASWITGEIININGGQYFV
ncbi:SDR family NAD(P)-dependent oxidoreductase [Mesorhizobium koreense]|uniref:SDR family NAD(P)-dependent oxidoreductase n=1 Tax=Mesorhizobium koreense TaxID=3074855 RepID=UPI00287BAC72|nr:glucose 1-dehydrogenase [Mesorhizobium sp. WR6]